ncbi:MAG: efflux RND transporter permease subunit, partial [Nevskiaceae bacterium]
AELNGEGEVVGGIVVLRYGQNSLETIAAVKARLETLKRGLPEGVEIVDAYDRSDLIGRAVNTLTTKLIEEFIIVALVCAAFLFHLRSSLVAIITLPLGILVAFIVMRYQGINANIMSLGGIAIAIGAMVDAAIVMIENAHKKLEAWRTRHPREPSRHPGESRDPVSSEKALDSRFRGNDNGNGHDGAVEPDAATRIKLITDAAAEVGPALFFSLLIITLSFVPVFTLQAQEGRLFSPLAFTKTYAMAAAAGLSVTLVPVLMVYFIRGKIRDEHENPLNRWLIAAYRPVLRWVLSRPWTTLGIAALALAVTAWPIARLGSEFLPPLYEGDLLYMPTAQPGISPAKASELLQQTDRIIKTFPEVHHVFGKIGRAETATDPAPLEMVETTVRLKPQEEWREGMTVEKLIEEMDATLQIPGMRNLWVQPIRNRIDMLATGIKSPVGVKVAGPDLAVVERVGTEIEGALKAVRGTNSAVFDRVTRGRYIDIVPDRLAAARYGLNIEDLQRIVAMAVGGENIGETVEGLQRFPINVRYPRELRDSVKDLQELPIVTMRGETVTLGQLARVEVVDGPPMIKSENSRPAGYVYVDIRDRDLGSYVAEAQRVVAGQVALPAGYSITWSGQFEYLERASKRLRVVVPFTLAIIFVLLYLTFRNAAEAALLMVTLPFALVGGLWLLYILGHN